MMYHVEVYQHVLACIIDVLYESIIHDNTREYAIIHLLNFGPSSEPPSSDDDSAVNLRSSRHGRRHFCVRRGRRPLAFGHIERLRRGVRNVRYLFVYVHTYIHIYIYTHTHTYAQTHLIQRFGLATALSQHCSELCALSLSLSLYIYIYICIYIYIPPHTHKHTHLIKRLGFTTALSKHRSELCALVPCGVELELDRASVVGAAVGGETLFNRHTLPRRRVRATC